MFSSRLGLICSIACGLNLIPVALPIDALTELTVLPAMAQSEADRKAEADRLFQQGFQQFQTQQFQAALESWQQSLTIYQLESVMQSFPESKGQVMQLLLGIGRIYSRLQQPLQALERYEQALAIAQATGDRITESTLLNNLGMVHRNLEEYPAALNYYEQALAIARQLNDRAGEGVALSNIGVIHNLQGDYAQAIERLQQALTIAKQLDDSAGQGRVLSNLGAVYENLGQYLLAMQQYQQALELRQTTGDRVGEGVTLNNIGVIQNRLGQYYQALTVHQQALTIRQEVGDRVGEAVTLSNLGAVYGNLGQYPLALQSFTAALVIAEAFDDQASAATSLNNIGWAHQQTGDYSQAAVQFQRALQIQQTIGDRAGMISTLNNQGTISSDLQNYEQALQQLQQALNLSQELNLPVAEATALNNIGRIYAQQKQYTAALKQYEQTLAIRQRIQDRAGAGDTLSNLGWVLYQTGQYNAAVDRLLQALELLESLRTPELSDAQKVAIFEQQATTYQVLQQTLIAQNQPEKNLTALQISERGRARALVELMATRLREHQVATPPEIEEIRRIAQQQNATLVQYSVINLEESDPAIYIWVIKPSGEIRFQSVDLAQLNQPLADLVALGRTAIGARSRSTAGTVVISVPPEVQRQREAEQRQVLQQLHQLLIQPIAADLPTDPNQRVVFIPQSELFLVPFAALIDTNGNYLIQNHTISTAPSIQVLDLAAQMRQPQPLNRLESDQVLVVGNPIMPSVWNPDRAEAIQLSSLPGSEAEAVTIAEQFNTTPLLWDQATETTVTQRMQTARLIHLATHGLLEYGDPVESGVLDAPGAIALAADNTNDGLLTARELYQMNLQADLVVLSACDTGRGRITGDGVVGLSRSLIQAGVPSLVVSLWKVPDDATAYLMTQFYQNLQQTSDKAQALRQAMLATLERYPAPLNWAAFTLIGEAE